MEATNSLVDETRQAQFFVGRSAGCKGTTQISSSSKMEMKRTRLYCSMLALRAVPQSLRDPGSYICVHCDKEKQPQHLPQPVGHVEATQTGEDRSYTVLLQTWPRNGDGALDILIAACFALLRTTKARFPTCSGRKASACRVNSRSS